MMKKGRGMSIFVSILDGDYNERAEEAKVAYRQLAVYIDYKNCEGVAEIIIAENMQEGFRGIVQTMGLGNLKPNIVVMRYPEIWRQENSKEISETFVSIIDDCIVANKAVVTVKGLDEWPGEYQKQFGTIDLYWIIRDGGLMLFLSQLLLTKESFESCKIQVFCIAEENTEAEELKIESGTVRQGDSLTKMPIKKKCLFVKTGAVVLCRIQVNDTICTGYSALLWHILKGPASKFHSRAEQTLRLLLDRFTYSISTNKCHGDDAIVEVVIRTIQ